MVGLTCDLWLLCPGGPVDRHMRDPKRFTHVIEIIAVLAVWCLKIQGLYYHYYPCRIFWVQHIKCTYTIRPNDRSHSAVKPGRTAFLGWNQERYSGAAWHVGQKYGATMVVIPSRSMVAMAFLVGFKMDSNKVPRVWANVNMWNWAKVKCESFLIVETPFLFRTPPHHTTSSAEMLDAFLGLYHAV